MVSLNPPGWNHEPLCSNGSQIEGPVAQPMAVSHTPAGRPCGFFFSVGKEDEAAVKLVMSLGRDENGPAAEC